MRWNMRVLSCVAAACTLAACSGNDATGPDALSAKGGGGKGGGETVWGNNLSVPVLFASGVGLTGATISTADVTTTGLRPSGTQAELAPAYAELPWARLVLPTIAGYYCQNTENTWMAEWLDNTAGGPDVPANAFWGDNLTSQQWNVSSVVRVETELQPTAPHALDGFNMPYASGSNRNEIKCTDGTTFTTDVANPPTIFSATARLTIEKLDGPGGDVACTYLDASTADKFGNDGPGYYGAEVNVSGRVIYGYNWMLNRPLTGDCTAESKAGWWRLTFWVDDARAGYQGNVRIVGTDGPGSKFSPAVCAVGNCTALEIEIAEAKSKRPSNPGKGE